MKGFLAYKPIGQQAKYKEGVWKSCAFSDIPEEAFFITDFQKNNCHFFMATTSFTDPGKWFYAYNKREDVISIDKSTYLSNLESFKTGMKKKGIEKAIFSRIELVNKENDISPLEIFDKLCIEYGENAFVYLVSDSSFGTWIGATPEILVEGNEKELKTMALAGTKKSEEVSWTEKELEEHRIVARYIKNVLEKIKAENILESELKTVKSGFVYHLRQDYTFSLKSDKWMDMVTQLHPTPAVCGNPLDKAERFILKNESHERLYYSGLIGEKNLSDLSVHVNLRCMQILENHYALYVGGGITRDSVPEKEWEETVNKSQTLLSVLKE